MNETFFSVIIPAHNAEEYMRRGLDSIEDQDFYDYQTIIICDACSDETEKIAAEYMTGPVDRLIITDYGRAGLARNEGLNAAIGEWVLFMDDDDWYLPGAFSTIAEAVSGRDDLDILAYGFDWKGYGVKMQSQQRIYPAIWNKAWRREFIGEERFPDWIHTDDYGFARKMHGRARFGFLNKALYYYNFLRPGSVSDRIGKGEIGSESIPIECRDAAISYEKWLRGLKR